MALGMQLTVPRKSAGKETHQRRMRQWKLLRRAAVAPLLFVLLGILLSTCRTALTPLPPEADRSYQKLFDVAT
jgi:hypothetical protein